MFTPNWIALSTLAGIIVLIVAAALQAGSPGVWSWRRYGLTVLVVGLITAGGVGAGWWSAQRIGGHKAALVLVVAVVLLALGVTAAQGIRGRSLRTGPKPKPQRSNLRKPSDAAAESKGLRAGPRKPGPRAKPGERQARR